MSPAAFTVPTPLEYFATLVASDAQFPLLEAAISLAQDDEPELDVQQVLDDIDQLAARLQRRVAADAPPLARLRALNQFFFADLGFAGNANDYYDPANSHIHAVLRTRRGIPVSLALVWLELAHALKLPARGVAFPGHYLVKVNLPKGQVVIDPFDGRSLSREALSERLEPYLRQRGLVGEFDMPIGLYLQAAMPRETIARMLRNLKEIHRSRHDGLRLLAVQERLVRLLPDGWTERRDRGLALAELGRPREALADLDAYLAHAEDALDVDAIAERAAALRQQQAG